MDSEKVLKIVEQLLQKQLTQIEQRVLILSWEGQSYKDIEENTGYVIGYLRDIGSNMWKELSQILQKRVTKKNLPLILEQLQQKDFILPINPQMDYIPEQPLDDSVAVSEKELLGFPSAPIPANSRLYVKRPPIEKLARNEIARQGCLLRIKAPQKMGKSSLLNQVIAQADSLGYLVAYLDFRDTEEAVFNSIDRMLHWFCAAICQQVNLPPNLDYYWDEDMGSKMSCKIFMESYILKHIDRPLVLTINEVNRIFEHPQTAVDFLPLLRSFHEQSRRSAVWQKLRLVLVYSTDIYVP
ncbi:MAG: AAA-like domain-containing protein, partial [Pleurocapsa sp.]